MHVDPHVLVKAAIELETSAAHLSSTLSATGPTLHVAPSGAEEVSTSAARYFNAASDSLNSSAGQAVKELVAAATLLRRQAAAYEFQDQLNEQNLRSTST
ncbi:hypothetical protein ABH922_004865 [Rhodococcus sp. 27YEA15]|uniref:PE family protein n=1 Tax=Rhodococcus sp. 27YEA15 TaxID=3156259 RepID=UPI003C7D7976